LALQLANLGVGEILALMLGSQASSAEVSVGVIDRRYEPAQLLHEAQAQTLA